MSDYRTTVDIREELRGIEEALKMTNDPAILRGLGRRRRELKDELVGVQRRLDEETRG